MRTGGAERLVSQLLPRFRQRGAEVHAAIFDGSDTPFMQSLVKEDVTLHVLGHGYSSMYDPRNILRLQRIMRQGFDIVHTHNTTPQLFTALARTPASTRLVTTEHNTSNRRRGHALLRQLDRWMYRRYDRIVCCSTPVETSLADSLDMPSLMPRILTISNGIDLGQFSGSHHTITSGKVNILMVAAFREQKDHLTPLHALAMLPPEVTLTYAGDGATCTATQEAARALGVADRVRFTGNVADIPGLYRQADIALLSTRHEGLSLSTVEAMASGMPLIVSDVPGVSEIVGDGALRFPFGDARALAARITSLLDNPALYAATARKGMERARLYDITVTADEYFNLYSSLISNKTNS